MLARQLASALPTLLDGCQFISFRKLLVIGIERVAARNKAVTRGRGAVAECTADAFAFQWPTSESVGWQLRIRKHHAPEADEIRPSCADDGLRDVWKVVLKIGVCGADDGNG